MSGDAITEERLYRINPQQVSLLDLQIKGRILDIGGGGEGIIGRVFKDKVIAIDPDRRELEDAPEGPIKLVMDAKVLAFLDASFDAVTSFFTLMFIPNSQHEQIFREIYRVLKPDGELYLWDVEIPAYKEGPKDIFVVPLQIHVPECTIDTGFGTRWKEKIQNPEYFAGLGERVGFVCDSTETRDKVFRMVFRKPAYHTI